jgi:hypothetical protein
VTVLLPRRISDTALRRVLHDRTAERIAGLVSEIPNASATIIPFMLGHRRRFRIARDLLAQAETEAVAVPSRDSTARRGESSPRTMTLTTTPIAELRWRQRAKVAGHIRSVRVQPGSGVSSLECTLVDATGQLLVVFQGRRVVPGIGPGVNLVVEGMVGERARRTAMVNPTYTILPGPAEDGAGSRG